MDIAAKAYRTTSSHERPPQGMTLLALRAVIADAATRQSPALTGFKKLDIEASMSY